MGRRVGVRITFITPEGVVLGDSHHDVPSMDNHDTRPEVLQAISEGEGASTRFSNTLQFDTIYLARTLTVEDEHLGTIRVSVPVQSVQSQVKRLAIALVVVMLLALMLSFLLVSVISRRMSRAVSNLGLVAAEFAAGNMSHQEIEAPGREFRDLTDALNHMARQLNEQIGQLEMQRNELDAILRSMESGVIAIDLDHRVLRLNQIGRASCRERV